MRYVLRQNIDPEKWDSLVRDSTNPHIYMLSWYLDKTCPNWSAMVWGDYDAVFPLYVKKLFLFHYVASPFLSQQTGLIFISGFDYEKALNDFFKNAFFKFLIRFKVNFHSGISKIQLTRGQKWSVESKKNYVLNLKPSFEELFRHFNDNRKRNFKKAHSSGWHCESSEDILSAIEMYKTFQGSKQKGLKGIYSVLISIHKECVNRNMSELFCCKNEKGEIVAWGFFAHFNNRIYYLFGAMNEAGKKHSAISLIFETVIKKYAFQDRFLDFEGGNLEGIGSYFASFGAIPEEYCSVTRNYI